MNNNNKKNDLSLFESESSTLNCIEETKIGLNHLNPIKHPQQDLFIADLFDALSLQLDQSSMEYPLFALKAGDIRPRYYEQKGFKVAITANATYGLATIHDKDVWIYAISKLMQAQAEGKPIDRTVHFTIYDYLKTTNRSVGGKDYERAKDSLDRLRGTSITTDIETDNKRESRGFGLIDHWKMVEEKDGRMIRVSVTLPEWLYRSVMSKNVLTLSPDYFRIRKPLDRRIYELARKHCGTNQQWVFNLKTLHERTGSTASIREFKRALKSLSDSNQLPDYDIIFIDRKQRSDVQKDDDQVKIMYRAWRSKAKKIECYEEEINYHEFSSGKYAGDTNEEVIVNIFVAGKHLSQKLIQKLNLSGKTINILKQRAQTIINGTTAPIPNSELESKNNLSENDRMSISMILDARKRGVFDADEWLQKEAERLGI